MRKIIFIATVLASLAMVVASCNKSDKEDPDNFCFAVPAFKPGTLDPERDEDGDPKWTPFTDTEWATEGITIGIFGPYNKKTGKFIFDTKASHFSYSTSNPKVMEGSVQEFGGELDGAKAIWLASGIIDDGPFETGSSEITLRYNNGKGIKFSYTFTYTRIN